MEKKKNLLAKSSSFRARIAFAPDVTRRRPSSAGALTREDTWHV